MAKATAKDTAKATIERIVGKSKIKNIGDGKYYNPGSKIMLTPTDEKRLEPHLVPKK